MKFLNRLTSLYPVWLILISVVAFLQPDLLSWYRGNWISASLMLVMLSMGFTLTVDDFKRVTLIPGCVAFGFGAQYTIMPFAAWIIARAMNLPPDFAVGLILVGSCPGGTASNVVTYLARGDLPLSVVLTMVSTLLAFIMTPLMCKFLAGQIVEVNALALCLSTLQVVVLPVVVGILCKWAFPKAVDCIVVICPFVSVLAICMITGGIVAGSASTLAQSAVQLTVAASSLHLLGFCVGYFLTRQSGFSETASRTVSIEVGMQNGGLAATLAQNFPLNPYAAVPAVFSALLQNLVGSLLAAWWRARPVPDSISEPVHSSAEGGLK